MADTSRQSSKKAVRAPLSSLTDPNRLASLEQVRIMDTEPETAFDDIAWLASQICGTPTAFVTFVDGDHQFFKASVGAGGIRTANIEEGFCPFTVAQGNTLVIPDTCADPRFSDNPAVTGEDSVRFYAGVPVRAPDGYVLGTVCVVDHKPRELDKDCLEALRSLGRQVEALLTLRASKAAVQERERRVRALYEITARPDIGFAEKIDTLLRTCREWLKLSIGVLARADCDAQTYEVRQVDSAIPAIAIGWTCPLNETFCSETISQDSDSPLLAVEHASADPQWKKHPGHLLYGTEAYLGAVVRVHGIIWGALGFAGQMPRVEPFTTFDRDIVRLMAQWIGGEFERMDAESALRATAVQQRRFVREMLASVTEGKLCLSDTEEDLPDPLPPVTESLTLTPEKLRVLREQTTKVAEDLNFEEERIQDLLTAVGEAGMNAIKHGGGGTARIHVNQDKSLIQVWVTDHGRGIREEDIPRATLEKGWSGAGSLGHGFYLMLRTVDRTYLATGPSGTTVVLEQERVPPQPSWMTAR